MNINDKLYKSLAVEIDFQKPVTRKNHGYIARKYIAILNEQELEDFSQKLKKIEPNKQKGIKVYNWSDNSIQYI